MKDKCYQLLIDLDDSKFEQMPNKRLMSDDNITQMHKNLWSMFDLRFTIDEMLELKKNGKEPFGMNVSDYAWTDSVKDAFYEHPFHFKLVKAMKRRKDMTWGMWVLNSEPRDVIDIKKLKEN